MTTTPHVSHKSRVALVVVVVLTAFIAVTTLPDYLSGGWPWTNSPESPHLKALRDVRDEGIALPGWQAIFYEKADFGGDQWIVQQFTKQAAAGNAAAASVALEDQIVLLLRPQGTDADQPEVEWIDIMGAQRWTVDSQQRLRIATAGGPVTVAFARAWNDQQTYAIAQWYAWSGGGHPSPGRWFWGDQLKQWQFHERLSWMAVSLLLPVPPLSAVDGTQPRLEQAVQAIQEALQIQIFNATEVAS
ncbi:MAG: cyanoexosortase B system-associated protein [Cyanobacteria bacterium J06632_22]